MLKSAYIKAAVFTFVALCGLNIHAQGFSWMVNGMTASHMGGREYSVTLPAGSTFADVIATPGSEKGDHVYMRYTFNNSLSLSSVPGWWTSSQDPWIDWTGDNGWEWRDSATSYSKRINNIPTSGSFRVIVECQNYDWSQSFVVNITVNAPSNQAPTTEWYPSTPTNLTLQTGVWQTFRALGRDVDGNLAGIWVEYAVKPPGGTWGGWNALAYDPVGVNGGDGYATPSNNNGFSPGSAGTQYKFQFRANDTAGATSGWNEQPQIFSVPGNQDPTSTITVLDQSRNPVSLDGSGRAALTLGQRFYVRVAGNDPEGALKELYLRIVRNGAQVGWGSVSASGANDYHDFGGEHGFTADWIGFWDVWAHSTDQTAGGWNPNPGNGWSSVQQPDIYVYEVPNSPPTASIAVNNPNPPFGATAVWTVTANDSDGTIDSVVFTRNGQTVPADPGSPFTHSHEGAANSSHMVSATITDNDGATVSTGSVISTFGTDPLTQAPAAPTHLWVNGGGGDVITVDWPSTPSGESVSHYNVYAEGELVATDIPNTTTAFTYDTFAPGGNNINIEVAAVGTNGLESTRSPLVTYNKPIVTEVGGDVSQGYFYQDMNADGILDRISSTRTGDFSFHVSEWETLMPGASPDIGSYFSSVAVGVQLTGIPGLPDNLVDAYSILYFSSTGPSFDFGNYLTTYVVTFDISEVLGETISIYARPAIDGVNGETVGNPEYWPIDINRWEQIMFNGAVDDFIDINTLGNILLTEELYDALDLDGRQYYMVRNGKPIRGMDLDIAGDLNIELGAGSGGIDSISLPNGVSFDVGGALEKIRLSPGTVVQIAGGVISRVTVGSASTTLPSGTSTTIGGHSVSVDGSGNLTVAVANGATIEYDIASGAKTIKGPAGWGVSIDGSGEISLVIPPGASPTATIIAKAVDTLGKIVQISQGAEWSVRDLLGGVVNLSATGTPIDLLDAKITDNGISQIGIKTSPDSDIIWINVSPQISIEYVDRDVPTRIWSDRVSSQGSVTLYAGETNGDMVEWSLSDSSRYASSTISWKAMHSDGTEILGPIGIGEVSWNISNISIPESLTWKPGDYEIIVTVDGHDLQFTQEIGWRTEEYLVVGQVKPLFEYDIGEGPKLTLRADLVADVARETNSIVPGGLIYLTTENTVLAWLGAEAFVTNSYTTPRVAYLPNVGNVEKLWMLQHILNVNPDLFDIPITLTVGQLNQLRTEKSYRMLSRAGYKYTLNDEGKIDSIISMATSVSEVGPTKVTIPAAAQIFFDWIPDLIIEGQIQMESEIATTSTTTIVDRVNGHISNFIGGRVGVEGQYPNYALFSRGAPYIHAEVRHDLDEEGKTSVETVRLSVDEVWSSDNVALGNTVFNEIRIMKRNSELEGAPFQVVKSYTFNPPASHLNDFIMSAPQGVFDVPEPEPSIENTNE
jgi:hypothetical protein